MNSIDPNHQSEDFLHEIDFDSTSSVDDFIKELEAKEKDLHITADMQIEIADPEFEAAVPEEFVKQELDSSSTDAGTEPSTSANVALKSRVSDLQSEVETLQDRIRGLRAERNEIQEKSDRRLKDFENYKYRMDRERRGAFIDQISNLACQMLPVLDNLDRALESAARLERPKSEEFQQFYDGIALVNQQVNEIFGEMGVQPIATIGETFDPNLHEAVAVEERPEMRSNTVIEEMLRGYRIGNRVIRHSMVKVTATAAPVQNGRSSAAIEEDKTDPSPDFPSEPETTPEETPSVSETP